MDGIKMNINYKIRYDAGLGFTKWEDYQGDCFPMEVIAQYLYTKGLLPQNEVVVEYWTDFWDNEDGNKEFCEIADSRLVVNFELVKIYKPVITKIEE
jgi:hypothetical protein